MARTVTTRDDGFFGVSGQPTSIYFATHAIAARVAANLDTADQPTLDDPSTPVSEGQQNTAILAAGLAAQAASTAAGTAESDAQTASDMASNALSAAGQAASAAAAAATAATTAQTTAATAAGATSILAASLVPVFFDEIWRARFREIAPPRPVFNLWTLDLCGGAQNNNDSQWNMRNGASRSNAFPMSVFCDGAGQNVSKVYTRAVLDQQNASWYFAGAGYWIGATIDGTGDHRAFTLDTADQARFISAGVHAAETGHFSFALAGGPSGPILVPSTVVYTEGFHTVEMRYTHLGDGVLEGSVDGEPWVTVGTAANIPTGAYLLSQDHGCFVGTGQIHVTLAAVGTSL